MRALAAGTRRGPAVVALVTGGGWIGVLTLPHLPAWGPVPLLVALTAAGVAALLAVRTGRARATAPRAPAEGRPPAPSSLAGRLGADPVAVLWRGDPAGGGRPRAVP